MQNTPILTIQMVPAGVELVLGALAKLPFEQSAPLIAEIRGQAEYQLQQLQQAAQNEAQAEGAAQTEEAVQGE